MEPVGIKVMNQPQAQFLFIRRMTHRIELLFQMLLQRLAVVHMAFQRRLKIVARKLARRRSRTVASIVRKATCLFPRRLRAGLKSVAHNLQRRIFCRMRIDFITQVKTRHGKQVERHNLLLAHALLLNLHGARGEFHSLRKRIGHGLNIAQNGRVVVE